MLLWLFSVNEVTMASCRLFESSCFKNCFFKGNKISIILLILSSSFETIITETDHVWFLLQLIDNVETELFHIFSCKFLLEHNQNYGSHS